MSQPNSIEAMKNQIKEIILLEKNADMFFNDIVEPFVNNFFEQRFLQQGKLEDDFLQQSLDDQKGRLCWLCADKPPKAQREKTLEMLRYVTLIKLIQFAHLNNDELAKFVNKDSVDSGENMIKNYLNLDNKELVREVEGFFLCDEKVSCLGYNPCNWLSEFLEQTWPKETIDKNDETEIVNMLLKLITSMFVHVESFETEKSYFRNIINYFIYAFGERFLSNTNSYANYLYQIGCLENMLFNPKINFIKLFNVDYESAKIYRQYIPIEKKVEWDINFLRANPQDEQVYADYLCQIGCLENVLFNPKINFIKLLNINAERAKIYRQFISAESLKVRFDRDVVWADHNKSLFVKILSSIKYYCLSKWIALLFDQFCKKEIDMTIEENYNISLEDKLDPVKTIDVVSLVQNENKQIDKRLDK